MPNNYLLVRYDVDYVAKKSKKISDHERTEIFLNFGCYFFLNLGGIEVLSTSTSELPVIRQKSSLGESHRHHQILKESIQDIDDSVNPPSIDQLHAVEAFSST